MLPLLTTDWDEFQDWLTHSGKDILLILGILAVVFLVFRSVFPRLARTAITRGTADEEMRRRADTIIGVVYRSAGVALILIGLVTVLPELGVDITAIVTGLGITGLALALGGWLFAASARRRLAPTIG